MNGVAKTSLLTAAMRAVESKRSDHDGRLFSDPFAEALAGVEGQTLLKRAIEVAGEQPAIAIRTAFFDDQIKQSLAANSRQIVMLAAGMDTRAYRMDFPSGSQLFEIDQPEVFTAKRKVLGPIPPHCQRHEIALDLREPWEELLLRSGFKQGERTTWLVEGLLMYLEETQVAILLQRLTGLATKGDVLLCDILSQDLLNAPYMKGQLDFLTSMGAPWKFGTNEPEQYLETMGWHATTSQPGEFAPTRWPFPTAPRHVPGVPRGFYVVARKTD